MLRILIRNLAWEIQIQDPSREKFGSRIRDIYHGSATLFLNRFSIDITFSKNWVGDPGSGKKSVVDSVADPGCLQNFLPKKFSKSSYEYGLRIPDPDPQYWLWIRIRDPDP